MPVFGTISQDKFQRVQFHYIAFQDADGRKHNGVLDDLDEIKKSIQKRLISISMQPHKFTKIQGDYVGNKIHAN